MERGLSRSTLLKFQSQTGSPSSSDQALPGSGQSEVSVSIPNGKPILFRRNTQGKQQWKEVVCFNPKREAHPLQTFGITIEVPAHCAVSIPNGKPILFRPRATIAARRALWFQSQTGSPSSSDWILPILINCSFLFQSQTGSPSSSDKQCHLYYDPEKAEFQSQTGSPSSSDSVSRSREVSFLFGFNPKREAHPLQTSLDFPG